MGPETEAVSFEQLREFDAKVQNDCRSLSAMCNVHMADSDLRRHKTHIELWAVLVVLLPAAPNKCMFTSLLAMHCFARGSPIL